MQLFIPSFHWGHPKAMSGCFLCTYACVGLWSCGKKLPDITYKIDDLNLKLYLLYPHVTLTSKDVLVAQV